MKTFRKQSLGLSVRKAITPVVCAGISVLGLSYHNAIAQEEPEVDSSETEEVVVTGSRIRTDGMESPNPVTVVTLDEIELIDPTNVIEGLAELPQFNGSYTGQNFGRRFLTSSPGTGTLSLRGLQGKSTLTLLDGKRVVSSTIWGGPNANLFPLQLLETVESVTGGATAVYGTDAVAGAVNFIIDKDFTGLRANVRTGITERGEGLNYSMELSGGFALTENTHVLLSTEYSKRDAETGLAGQEWFTGTQYVDNPDENAGESFDNPRLIPAPMVVPTDYSLTGVIHFPEDSGIDPYILDEEGNASPFEFGSPVSYSTNDPTNPYEHSIANGGSGDYPDLYSYQISRFSESESFYANINHDFAHNLNVYTQIMYGVSENRSLDNSDNDLYDFADYSQDDFFGLPFGDAIRVFSGNPYIPENIQQIMTDNNIPHLQIGKVAHPSDLGLAYQAQETETLQVTVGADYEFATDNFLDGWRVQAYAQTGKTDSYWWQEGQLREDRFYRAVDAVVDPDSGEIVCRTTLPQYRNSSINVDYQDCVPYNPFGPGAASPEAMDWVTDFDPGIAYGVDGYYVNNDGEYDPIYYEYVSDGTKGRVNDLSQNELDISADGMLHEGWGAGPLSMALGYSYREEEFQQVIKAGGPNPAGDPSFFISQYPNGGNGLRGGPYYLPSQNEALKNSKIPFAKGAFDVHESFVEFRVPVMADLPLIEQFNIGASARWADYSGVGEFWSWKFGYDWNVAREFRLRGTVSQDIRAPSMGERFDRRGGSTRVTDYGTDIDGSSRYRVSYSSTGGSDLATEKAKTYTAGFVYQPEWMDGFRFSLDWYWIRIDDVIAQYGIQDTVAGCYGYEEPAQPALCSNIIRLDPDAPASEDNPITLIFNPYINQEYTENRGADFEFSYRSSINIFGGRESVSVRLLGSYQASQVYNIDGENPREFIGVYWPAWNWRVNTSYNRGRLSASLSTSFRPQVDSVNRNQGDVIDVASTKRPTDVILNGRLGYSWDMGNGSSLRASLSVNNLFDKSPAPYYESSLGVSGDRQGRRYSLSLNLRY